MYIVVNSLTFSDSFLIRETYIRKESTILIKYSSLHPNTRRCSSDGKQKANLFLLKIKNYNWSYIFKVL